MIKRGALFVLEGCDRTGKSTQCRRLVEALCQAGIRAELRRFPDRTTITGQMIDQYLTGKQQLDDHVIHLLFSANRWEAMTEMRQKLQSGVTLVVDRYAYSGVVFSAAKGLDIHWCQQPDVGLLRPDKVFLLDMPIEEAIRRGGFGQERYEKASMQQRVRELFLKLREPDWCVVDARRSMDEIHIELFKHASALIAECSTTPLREDLWQS